MRFIKYWLPLLVWAAGIFLLSSRPSTKVSGDYWINFAVFKTLHIFEYFILYVLFYRMFTNASRFDRKKIFVLSFILTVLYAISDEIHQRFVPTREGKLRDVFIDAIGAAIAMVSLWKSSAILPTKLRRWVKTLDLN